MAMSTRWWQQPDHYDWLSGYLYARGWGTGTRVMLASMSAAMTLNCVLLWASVDHPRGPVSVAVSILAFAGGIAASLLWAWRWPTRRQSIMFVVVANAALALTCLTVHNPWAALTGCISFAMTGAYSAFFHTTGLMVYNFVVAASVGGIAAFGVWSSGHQAVAWLDLWLVLQINIALPVAIALLVRALGVDLIGADRDPLTGLLNRRSFRHHVRGLLAVRGTHDRYLVAVVVDLDDFKAINDTHGHSAGDEVLVQVAHALRSAARPGAVVARSGGEEFTIADILADPDPTPLATQVCTAIADLPARITASVGTACAQIDGVDDGMHRQLMKQLLNAADMAMYHAKRSGGNRFHHQGLCNPSGGHDTADGQLSNP
ncbi:GGDEF domain-containing protein [Mycolicibacterium sp. CH28]|nr:GGDEF domain-containing protein [Mycolicibacterium sp. CH28]